MHIINKFSTRFLKGSVVPYDPADAAVLKELEEAEREAKETAKIVNELKQRVGQLLKVRIELHKTAISNKTPLYYHYNDRKKK